MSWVLGEGVDPEGCGNGQALCYLLERPLAHEGRQEVGCGKASALTSVGRDAWLCRWALAPSHSA